MALTASAQSPFPRERAWDQVIVPTLRKRLQDESHVLSKRMSAASITSDEGRPVDAYQAEISTQRVTSPTYSNSKPSAIPRPSLQHSRTETTTSQHSAGRSSNSGSFKRPRTNSQPMPFDPHNGSSPPLPHQPARSESPYTNSSKGTRIPVSRGRTGSTSSFQPSINGRSDSRTGLSKMNGSGYTYDTTTTALDLYPVEEVHASSVNSRSTAFRTPRSQFSELAGEQAPFNANSVSSRISNYHAADYAQPRPSNDSEERPFEHWYRGDVSRNGGVGELRVARRKEMLDIANYGHTLRQASSRLAGGSGTRSRSNSQGRDGFSHSSPRSRPRADSLGARQSIYLDDDEQAKAAMVFDEQPLTDLDSDGEVYEEEEDNYDDGEGDEDMTERVEYSPRMNGSVSPPPPLYDRSTTPTSTKELNKANFQSRIPTPTPRVIADPPRTPTPTQAVSTPSTPHSRTNTQTQTQAPPQSSTLSTQSTASAQRRGKSPGPVKPANAAKKARTKSKSPAKPKKEVDRRSVSVYPAPDGDDIVHAIPSWTQPVEANGNWDDVVLPAVARKKGLEGYEKADGSPKPKPPGPPVYEPAPGTFGIDHTKYRPPRVSADIPMDEFGQRKEPSPPSPPASPVPQSPVRTQPPPSPHPSIPRRAESPAPFSHYVAENGVGIAPIIKDVSRPPPPVMMEQREDDGGGCCKCVIM
ncbi:hypothetical protein BXZ70DRAFT_902367 [Cristinia sonorae]|uniref:Uncharacterized protein n=1 Tax=Cristinia sonorae TaxID=1940300 RepID=A0A8K0UDI7_9AGAR|nr:hypothetical protein BXZ70DRAFT_902367 [Cristinia sonorae]